MAGGGSLDRPWLHGEPCLSLSLKVRLLIMDYFEARCNQVTLP